MGSGRAAKPAEVRHSGHVRALNDDAVSIVPILPAFVIPVLRVLEGGRTLRRKDVSSTKQPKCGP